MQRMRVCELGFPRLWQVLLCHLLRSQQMLTQQASMHDCMCDVTCAGKSAGMILRQINAEALAEAETLHVEQTCDMMKMCSLSSHSGHPAPLLGSLPATDQQYAR